MSFYKVSYEAYVIKEMLHQNMEIGTTNSKACIVLNKNLITLMRLCYKEKPIHLIRAVINKYNIIQYPLNL